MKYFALFLILSIWTAGVAPQNPIQSLAIHIVRGICQFQTGVSQDLVLQVRAWNFTSDDAKLKNYVYCVYTNLQIMDKNANVNIQTSIALLPSQTDPLKFVAAVNACAGVTGTYLYDTAYNRIKCYNMQYPKDIIAL